ncbi:MAG: hypothetical protein ACTHJN_05140 [Ginsengibacter sp.]
MKANKRYKSSKAKSVTIPKRSLHFILHYLLLQQQWTSKLPSYQSHTLKANTFRIYQYYKHFRAVSRIKDTALCLLKTKYAIKPKHPI